LFMRKTGDKRCDSVIKKEIYDEIKKSYEIEFVLDDRKRVKRMFVENDVFVLDVNQTDEEF
ncbi:MAG: polynucleotide kinase, partial [archaeon]|nr:polynucleotide kinase [archaeon]